ncbi:hypothetical protein IFM89_022984 [Coptis chinensis]|uniref:Pentatricopeptide repeat-containing protein n=1 Tax=Coptis chinensis TaxID=261450 RepID=A0A835IEZ5_9MAGN|nr:hypothetical protein IFM89_022984 [Coptis chinensis]
MEGLSSSSSLLLTNSSPSSKLHKTTSPSSKIQTKPPPNSKRPIFIKKKQTSKFPSKTQKFSQKDAFPQSLPLHKKNPSSIYKDIQNFARENKLKEALTILDYLEKEGIPVNTTTFSSLLNACVRTKSLGYGKQVHTHIRINGLDNNEFLRTRLVHMYSSCGSMEDAEKVFDELSTRSSCVSVYPWNALLRGNVVRGGWRCGDVLDTYSKMREMGVGMNVYTFSCLIKSFAGSSALTQGLKVHALLVKNGFGDGSIVIQTSLIDMYFKCGKIKLARLLFEEMDKIDVVVWGAMISGFAHNRLHKEALEYLRWMVREGVELNSVILTAALPAVGELWASYLGKEIHGYVIKTKNYANQLFIQSSLIDMYCKCGDMVSGRQVFRRSEVRDVISWTALISGYISNGRLDQALRSMIWMQQEGVKPDVVTIATVLPVCAQLKALKQGKEIHGYVIKNGYLPNVSIVTSLMVMYSRSGCLEYSCKLFDGTERRNVISWTAMIESFLKNQCLDEALVVFRSMQLSKHRPDPVTMSRILRVCGDMGELKFGKEVHGHVLRRDFVSVPFVSAEIVKMYGNSGEIEKAKLVFDTNPSKGSMTWTALIEAYGHNNRHQDALNLYDLMITNGFKPNHFTFQVVLSICDKAGFVNEACQIFDSMAKRYNVKPSEEHFNSIIELLTRLQFADEVLRYVRLKSSILQVDKMVC